jgi:hypothetical protein
MEYRKTGGLHIVLINRRIAAIMGNSFAGGIYVVVATKEGRTEFWAAATHRDRAAVEVRKLLPQGWTTVFTGWRLTSDKAAKLRMRANSVRKLKQAPK